MLANKQQELNENAKICYDCKEKFEGKYIKVRDHCYYKGEYRGTADSTYNLNFSVPKEIFIDSHNESNYFYLFIISIAVNIL